MTITKLQMRRQKITNTFKEDMVMKINEKAAKAVFYAVIGMIGAAAITCIIISMVVL